MNIYSKIIGLASGLLLFNACYDDQGNYDYHPINDVVITDAGFKRISDPSKDSIYRLTAFVDTLKITPVFTASLQPDLSNYEFEWVARGGNNLTDIKQFYLSNTFALNYFVELPTMSYTIYFRMKDLTTGIIYTQSAALEINDIFSTGLLVLGENDEGYAQLDMVATPYQADTVVLKNITLNKGLPKLKGPKLIYSNTYPRKNEIHLSTDDGSYWLSRKDFASGPEYFYRSMFLEPTVTDKFVIQDFVQQAGTYRVAIVDGKLFSATSMIESSLFGAVSNRYKGKYDYFNIGDKMATNYKRNNTFILYNTDAKRFVSFVATNIYCDSLNDTQSDKTIFSWKTGLDYVTTINSTYTTSSYCYTILKNNEGQYYLYSYAIGSWGAVKNKRWELTGATHIADAKFFGHSNTTGTYLFYSVGSQLYGYDYVRGIEYPLKDFSGEVITCQFHVIRTSTGGAASGSDNFYIATYDPNKPKSVGGTLHGFKVLNDVNKISIEPIPGEKWDGLCKVVSVDYK